MSAVRIPKAGSWSVTSDQRAVIRSMHEPCIAIVVGAGEDPAKVAGYARLIAAAPDLLTALQAFIPESLKEFEDILWGDKPDDALGTVSIKMGQIRAARAAIAKATAA